MTSAADISWAAGFVDGEGSFTRHNRTICVQAVQKDRWPLDKLQGLLGGTVYRFERDAVRGRTYYRWNVYGKQAAAAMMTMFVVLSPRRQERIESLLNWWKEIPLRGHHNRSKTHCKRGHEFTSDNTYVKPGGGRQCKICQKATSKEHHERSLYQQ